MTDSPPIAPSDERMVPEYANPHTFWEHVHRYRFASRYAKGKVVLDIACGEGYGSAALSKAGALCVTASDVSEEACDHVRRRYGLDAVQADAENLPFSDAIFDLVVSFETIEHIMNPDRFVAESSRILRPKGQMIVSTPNLTVYNEIAEPNPYHCSEMTDVEFVSLLRRHFRSIKTYSQRPLHAPWWSLRGLAAERSVWSRRGLRKLRRAIWARRGLLALDRRTNEARANVVEAIAGARSEWCSIDNPFAVIPTSRLMPEKSLFTVVVATK